MRCMQNFQNQRRNKYIHEWKNKQKGRKEKNNKKVKEKMVFCGFFDKIISKRKGHFVFLFSFLFFLFFHCSENIFCRIKNKEKNQDFQNLLINLNGSFFKKKKNSVFEKNERFGIFFRVSNCFKLRHSSETETKIVVGNQSQYSIMNSNSPSKVTHALNVILYELKKHTFIQILRG